MKQLLSPRQAALSMGVSESSLKRWCDRGVLPTRRTAGGHRKIPVSAVVSFLRENSRELVRPEIIGLPNRISTPDQSLSSAIEPLAKALTSGDAELCRRIAFGLYLGGQSLAHICDELLRPTLALIGEGWNQGEVEVFEEHRAAEIVVRLLHEFRMTIEPAKHPAAVAMGGSVAGDAYSLPTRMIELSLLEAGWHATSLGTSLPFDTLLSAVRKNRPRLFWLSVSTLKNRADFVQDLNHFSEQVSSSTAVFVGGRALSGELRKQIQFAKVCDDIRQLVATSQTVLHRHIQQSN